MSQQQTLKKLRQKTKQETKRVIMMTSVREIVNKLLKIMKQHIGEENSISRNQLFKSVYGVPVENVSALQEWMLFELIKKAMHLCRQRTKCFIVSRQMTQQFGKRYGTWYYWVAKDGTDYIVFSDNMNRNIVAMKKMVEKCDKAVRNRWYQQEWSFATKRENEQ